MCLIDALSSRYWAALVEKAAAKLRGSYAKMEAISMRDSMTMLVGASCVSYNRKDDAAFVDFELCDKWQRRGALFLASHQGEGNVNGIHGNHAYSVLQVSALPSSYCAMKRSFKVAASSSSLHLLSTTQTLPAVRVVSRRAAGEAAQPLGPRHMEGSVVANFGKVQGGTRRIAQDAGHEAIG
jgi:hypothetical protein